MSKYDYKKNNYFLCLIDCAFTLLEKEHECSYIVVERTYKKNTFEFTEGDVWFVNFFG